MRKLAAAFLTSAFFGLLVTGPVAAQHIHHGHHQKGHAQKNGEPESGQPPANPEAGFAAPPRSGTREGATGGVGINGPSIELPAMSIKLPTIRIPGLTRFTTPPHMRVAKAIAPLVAAARQEFSFESGAAPESGTPPGDNDEGDPESGAPTPLQKELQKTYQKAAYDDCPECQRELQLAKVQVDDSLDNRLSRLESSIGRLVDGLEAVQAQTLKPQANNYLQPFPAVTTQDEFPVRRSSYQRPSSYQQRSEYQEPERYQQVERLPPRLLPTQIHRLPRVR